MDQSNLDDLPCVGDRRAGDSWFISDVEPGWMGNLGGSSGSVFYSGAAVASNCLLKWIAEKNQLSANSDDRRYRG